MFDVITNHAHLLYLSLRPGENPDIAQLALPGVDWP